MGADTHQRAGSMEGWTPEDGYFSSWWYGTFSLWGTWSPPVQYIMNSMTHQHITHTAEPTGCNTESARRQRSRDFPIHIGGQLSNYKSRQSSSWTTLAI